MKDKHVYKFNRGEEQYIIFDSNGFVIEAKGFGLYIWCANINIDKEIVGKHIDEVAELLKKKGKSQLEYYRFEADIHVEILKAMVENLKNQKDK